MPVALLLIGAILIIVAFNNTMGQLAHELIDDVPGYFVWMVAIVAILALGYVPQLKTPSRWLLGLVILVVVLTQYQKIIDGFQSFAQSGGKAIGSDAPDPATAFPSSPAGPLPTQAQVTGDAGGGPTVAGAKASVAGGSSAGTALGAAGMIAAANPVAAAGTILNYTNPSSYVSAIEGGFGGIASGVGDFLGGLF